MLIDLLAALAVGTLVGLGMLAKLIGKGLFSWWKNKYLPGEVLWEEVVFQFQLENWPPTDPTTKERLSTANRILLNHFERLNKQEQVQVLQLFQSILYKMRQLREINVSQPGANPALEQWCSTQLAEIEESWNEANILDIELLSRTGTSPVAQLRLERAVNQEIEETLQRARHRSLTQKTSEHPPPIPKRDTESK